MTLPSYFHTLSGSTISIPITVTGRLPPSCLANVNLQIYRTM